MTPMRRAILLLLATAALNAQPSFRAHGVDADIPGAYQTLAVDLNRDGRPDIVGLSQRSDALYWYENPSWTRRPLVEGMHRMITVAAADLDDDGVPELALGTHFNQTDETSEGRLYIVRAGADPAKLWTATEIDRLPTTHRVRFIDVDSDGDPELVNSPLAGPGCRKPLFDCSTPLVYYEPGEWKRKVISADLDGVVHGMREADWNGPVVLTASMGGVVGFRLAADGRWERRHLVSGSPNERPGNGASEIRLGSLGGERFLATIEPWHGNQVVVYRRAGRNDWPRTIVDDSLNDGHVLNTADFDQDGDDEILAGFRGEPYNLYLYRFAHGAWKRSTIDAGGIAGAGCDIADIDLDSDLDVVCIGSRTHNIKWYENLLR